MSAVAPKAEVLIHNSIVGRVRATGSEPRPSPPDELKIRLEADLAKWAAVIGAAGIERI